MVAHPCLRPIDIVFSEPPTLPDNQFIFELCLCVSAIAQANRSFPPLSLSRHFRDQIHSRCDVELVCNCPEGAGSLALAR
jgi:hypothetical protein